MTSTGPFPLLALSHPEKSPQFHGVRRLQSISLIAWRFQLPAHYRIAHPPARPTMILFRPSYGDITVQHLPLIWPAAWKDLCVARRPIVRPLDPPTTTPTLPLRTRNVYCLRTLHIASLRALLQHH